MALVLERNFSGIQTTIISPSRFHVDSLETIFTIYTIDPATGKNISFFEESSFYRIVIEEIQQGNILSSSNKIFYSKHNTLSNKLLTLDIEQANGTLKLREGNNYKLKFDVIGSTIVTLAPGGLISGAQNVGTYPIHVFQNEAGGILNFRSIQADFSSGLDYSQDVPNPGEIRLVNVLEGATLGTGEPVYIQKTTITGQPRLTFKSVTSNNPVPTSQPLALSSTATELEVSFDPAQLDHQDIGGIGSYTHQDIDFHIDDTTIHFTEGSIDHANILNVGTNTHAQIDAHLADSSVHFTEGSISHSNILNVGTNTHAQIDTHIADSTIHFTEGSIDHANILNVGTNTHAQIDTHIADTTIHFNATTLVDPLDNNKVIVASSNENIISYPPTVPSYPFSGLNSYPSVKAHFIANDAVNTPPWFWANFSTGSNKITIQQNGLSIQKISNYLQFNNGITGGSGLAGFFEIISTWQAWSTAFNPYLTFWFVVENVSIDGPPGTYGIVNGFATGGGSSTFTLAMESGSPNLWLRKPTDTWLSSGTANADTGYDITTPGKKIVIVSVDPLRNVNVRVNNSIVYSDVFNSSGNIPLERNVMGSTEWFSQTTAVRMNLYDFGGIQLNPTGPTDYTNIYEALASEYAPELLPQQDSNLNLNRINDVVISNPLVGNHLFYNGTNFVNRPSNNGTIKINNGNGIQPTYIGLTTPQAITYASPLSISSFPTSSPCLAINNGVFTDADIYLFGTNRFLEQQLPSNIHGGQIHLWRFILNYSNKSASNSGNITISLSNALSGFVAKATFSLPQGVTAENNRYSELITIADNASKLPAVSGTGQGYDLTIEASTSVDVVITSIARIAYEYPQRA